MDAIPPPGFTPCQPPLGFSMLSGPYFEKRLAEGGFVRGFRAEDRHLNPEGVVHGGVMTSFADFMLYRTIGDELTHQVLFATISLTTHFLAAGKSGGWIEGRGRIVRRTKSVVFAEGEIRDESRPLMTAMGVWKILGT
jgi:uncharacterized protein (TIGR00369 family)